MTSIYWHIGHAVKSNGTVDTYVSDGKGGLVLAKEKLMNEMFDNLIDYIDNHNVLKMKRDQIPTADQWNWGMAEANRLQAEQVARREFERLLGRA